MCLAALAVPLGGCTSPLEYVRNGFKVGPNYGRPPAPVAKEWIDASDARLAKRPDDLCNWWTVFKDPVLDQLVCYAYKQNLTLRQAGFRVLQARAQLGIAVGQLFPQTQFNRESFTWEAASAKTSSNSFRSSRFNSQWDLGFNLAWELDFWGRFRRLVESAGAELDASVEDYDAVLVTLLSDVATNYVQLRTTEQRIKYANANVELQQTTVNLLSRRKEVDANGQLNLDQAKSVLEQTKAAIPELEINQRQFTNQLCILLGIPPEDLRSRLGAAPIPTTPPDVAVGIPADLLRRRPDVLRAERRLAAQSALIGVAESEFYPHISLVGTLGYSATRFKDLFNPAAFDGAFGPTVQWNILNYGRLLNNVRFQDARFQELAAAYQQSVLTAQQEAENGLVTFLKAQQRTGFLVDSVKFSEAAKKVAPAKFDLKEITIPQLFQIQENLVLQQDALAVSQGEIALGLIEVYRALGGGWQIRLTGCDGPAGLQPPPPVPEVWPAPRLLPPTTLPPVLWDGKRAPD